LFRLTGSGYKTRDAEAKKEVGVRGGTLEMIIGVLAVLIVLIFLLRLLGLGI
jgi:hypothetical protein